MVSMSGKIIAEALAQMKKVKEVIELMIEMGVYFERSKEFTFISNHTYHRI